MEVEEIFIDGYLSIVNYSCIEGYRHVSGDLTRHCVHPGQWSGQLPTCEGKLTHVTCPIQRGDRL